MSENTATQICRHKKVNSNYMNQVHRCEECKTTYSGNDQLKEARETADRDTVISLLQELNERTSGFEEITLKIYESLAAQAQQPPIAQAKK